MKRLTLAGTAGLAALMALAAPAAGQYYPPPQQNPRPGGLAGAIIDQVMGYGRYPYGNYGYDTYGRQSYLIDQCARAVEARLNNYLPQGYRGANYNRYRNVGRVEGITRVEGRKNGGLKVWGVASSGYGGYQGWNRPGYGSYGYSDGADLKWDCKVNRDGRVSKVDVDRRPYNWRGY